MEEDGKTFEEYLRAGISEEELARIMVKHACHSNPNVAYRWYVMLLEKLDLGSASIGEIVSSFEGVEEKSVSDWNEGVWDDE